MAMEAECLLRIGREQYHGTAKLESEHIDFAGTTKFRFRFSEIRNPARSDAELTFSFHGNNVRMELGLRCEKWLESILHPKTPAEKLGIRPGFSVRFLNFDDAELFAELRQKKVRFLDSDDAVPCDAIVLSVERPAELRQIARLADEIRPDGAIWVILPKTSKTITAANVLAASRAAGLSDTKPISFNETMCAYRIVVPADKRGTRTAPPGRTLRTAAGANGNGHAAPRRTTRPTATRQKVAAR